MALELWNRVAQVALLDSETNPGATPQLVSQWVHPKRAFIVWGDGSTYMVHLSWLKSGKGREVYSVDEQEWELKLQSGGCSNDSNAREYDLGNGPLAFACPRVYGWVHCEWQNETVSVLVVQKVVWNFRDFTEKCFTVCPTAQTIYALFLLIGNVVEMMRSCSSLQRFLFKDTRWDTIGVTGDYVVRFVDFDIVLHDCLNTHDEWDRWNTALRPFLEDLKRCAFSDLPEGWKNPMLTIHQHFETVWLENQNNQAPPSQVLIQKVRKRSFSVAMCAPGVPAGASLPLSVLDEDPTACRLTADEEAMEDCMGNLAAAQRRAQ